jgi:hypothetical protein
MKMFATLADRASLPTFKLLAALHGALFLAFLASLLVAAGRL